MTTTVTMTKAMEALEKNLDSLTHIIDFTQREVKELSFLSAEIAKLDLPTDRVDFSKRLRKSLRGMNRISRKMGDRTEKLQTLWRWQVVTVVTCVEAYLHDILVAAATVDPKLMAKSEQPAKYAQVLRATSLEDLIHEMRGKWARSWIDEGGPGLWIATLSKMGARGYVDGLSQRMERFWGIRHLIVHAAGIATPDFVRRHPGIVKSIGDRVTMKSMKLDELSKIISDFIEPTEAYFIKRYPELTVSTA